MYFVHKPSEIEILRKMDEPGRKANMKNSSKLYQVSDNTRLMFANYPPFSRLDFSHSFELLIETEEKRNITILTKIYQEVVQGKTLHNSIEVQQVFSFRLWRHLYW